ncbi:Retrovirus-related Pol polyprotein LINE-1 [Cricetulus griseus]|uniref:Retrovirus-related Pol polyprotein LINE-1 n=1 Tax=Cricetulus griseus TaxID=10029 RepID=G3HUT6_CRIGR|nr:Retrovirus-related Pol polyprotein LINE-1 [Cricetulus griseus]
MDLTNIYRTFHSNIKEYTFFSASHRTFFRIDHKLEHKTTLTKYKNFETTACILFDCHKLKLDINNNRNLTNSWKLNNSLLNDRIGQDKLRMRFRTF